MIENYMINRLVECLFSSSGSHSLWALSTFIIGETPFPEFSSVAMLDDIQLSYYDSNVGKIIYRQYRSEHVQEVHEDAINIYGEVYNNMKHRALLTSQKLNSTHGIHVQQRLAGCELLDNGTAGPLRSWNAFNGVNEEELQYNTEQKTIEVEGVWSATWSYLERNQVEWMYANIYHPICIKALKRCLHIKKNHVMRKVKPRVRLLQKTVPDSGGVKVNCLATGFYPRHINLTLLRDGQPVPDHQITGGELLPNGDGTYQMRKSLEVSVVELREKHQYTCRAEHISLDNKLDFGLGKYFNSNRYYQSQLILIFSALDDNLIWNKAMVRKSYDIIDHVFTKSATEYEPGEPLVPIAASLLVLLVVVVGGTAGFILWKRRQRGKSLLLMQALAKEWCANYNGFFKNSPMWLFCIT
ncbi:hypothetical protein ACEWY4_012085 [Coilia grayii]|uniref:Ig-like domain-containing protein n=1 Tax=Coilia grayii TaxID=363190 RepID=A0ABD1JZJ1_9TELE